MATDSTDLEIAVDEPRAWARRLRITVPADRIERERQGVARRLAGQIRLPGFRKGRVPPHVVEQRFGATIDRETVERVVSTAYREAVQRQDFQPISEGEVGNIDYSRGADLTFDVEFEVQPEIELDRVGGFTIERERAEITDDEVDRVLERLREENAEWRAVEEGSPEPDDRVVVDMLPLTDEAGEPEDAKPREYEIVLGKDQALPDVEDAIRTLEAGEQQDFTIKLPAEAGEEGAPEEDHQVRIHLKRVERAELPELDDAFAASVGEFESLDELRTRIREDLEAEAEQESERQLRQRLIEAVIEANPFDVPNAMVDKYVEQLLQGQAPPDPQQLAELRSAAAPAAERAIKRMLIVEAIADRQGLRATEDDLDERVEEIAERNDRPAGEVYSQLQRSGRLRALEDQITEDRVFEYLKSESTIE